MEPHLFAARLVGDITKAKDIAQFSMSVSDLMLMAKKYPLDMDHFSLESTITSTMPNLKGRIGQLTQMLSIHRDLGKLNPNDLQDLETNVIEKHSAIEEALEKLLGGGMVSFPEYNVPKMVESMLNDIHNDANHLHSLCQKAAMKRK